MKNHIAISPGPKVGPPFTTLGGPMFQKLKIEESSFIAGAAYDAGIEELQVDIGDRRYVYTDVPVEIALDFVNAESAGGFYNRAIKGEFETVDTTADITELTQVCRALVQAQFDLMHRVEWDSFKKPDDVSLLEKYRDLSILVNELGDILVRNGGLRL